MSCPPANFSTLVEKTCNLDKSTFAYDDSCCNTQRDTVDPQHKLAYDCFQVVGTYTTPDGAIHHTTCNVVDMKANAHLFHLFTHTWNAAHTAANAGYQSYGCQESPENNKCECSYMGCDASRGFHCFGNEDECKNTCKKYTTGPNGTCVPQVPVNNQPTAAFCSAVANVCTAANPCNPDDPMNWGERLEQDPACSRNNSADCSLDLAKGSTCSQCPSGCGSSVQPSGGCTSDSDCSTNQTCTNGNCVDNGGGGTWSSEDISEFKVSFIKAEPTDMPEDIKEDVYNCVQPQLMAAYPDYTDFMTKSAANDPDLLALGTQLTTSCLSKYNSQPTCSKSSQCPAGYVCNDGKCVAKPPPDTGISPGIIVLIISCGLLLAALIVWFFFLRKK